MVVAAVLSWLILFTGESVDSQLETLIALQDLDAKITGLEAEAARLPRQIDAIQTALLLYLVIGPSGAALSVDRYLSVARSRRWRRGPSGGFLAEFLAPPPSASANFALRLMQIHFCIIYAASGLSKLQGAAWWNGTALWGTMANPEFNPVDSWLYHSFLVFLCQNRVLWEIVMTGGSISTVALEIAFDLFGAVGVVENQPIAAFTGDRAAHGGRHHDATARVMKLCLGMLISSEPHLRESSSVPVGLQDQSTIEAVLVRQAFTVADAEEPAARVPDPFPDGPQDGREKRLAMSRRHVDDQAIDFTAADPLKLVGDGRDVPIRQIGSSWIQGCQATLQETLEIIT